MKIPIEMLDAETLKAIIEEFVTRDGTDLSDVKERVFGVRVQLKEGTAQVVFDEESKSCNIVLV